jgi:hypothetical protein
MTEPPGSFGHEPVSEPIPTSNVETSTS